MASPGDKAAAASLVGLKSQQLVAMLGEPTFKRSEGPAEIWTYRSPSCALDLVFFGPDVTHAETRLRAEAEGLDPRAGDRAGCVAQVAQARQPRTAMPAAFAPEG